MNNYALWLFFAFIGAGFCLLGFLGMLFSLNEVYLGSTSQSWPRVKGTVVEATLWEYQVRPGGGRGPRSSVTQYQEHIVYDYIVNEKRYRNDRVAFKGDQKKTGIGSQNRRYHQSIVDRYPVGREIEVYYSPNDPGMSVLEPGRTSGATGMLFLTCGFLVVGSLLVGAPVVVWKMKTRKPKPT